MENSNITPPESTPAVDEATLVCVRPETEADSRALNDLVRRFQPGEEFDSWGAPLRRAKYRLKRLFDQGFLDRRLELNPDSFDGPVCVYYWLKG